MTTGVRALGRLAFCDNYRAIVRRLQMELDACLEPNALPGAARQSGLGLRSNRPRVYVVANLAGGTGGGVFLDLAYTLRAMLRQMGYAQPDVVGLLLLPPVDRHRTRVLPLGNACAALTELSYYSSPTSVFTARYHEREAPVQDPDPPFSRCFLLQMPDEADETATRELIDSAGQFLHRDLCSPLGKAADLGRAGLSAPPWEQRGPVLPDVRPVPPVLAAARAAARGRPPPLPAPRAALDEQGQQAAARGGAGLGPGAVGQPRDGRRRDDRPLSRRL